MALSRIISEAHVEFNQNTWTYIYANLTSRRHIWADIRPYVCPVKGCDADANQFLSRTDFGAHLKEHHSTNSLGNKSTEHISTLRCPFCNELPGAVAIIGHICHHLEVESCSVFFYKISERRLKAASI